MVRTEPVRENLANLKLSFGASPGPVVRPTEVKNDFLLAYRGVGIGDDVAIDKGKRQKTGRVTQMLRKGIVCVSDTPSRRRTLEPRPRRAPHASRANPLFNVLPSRPPSRGADYGESVTACPL